MNQAGWFTPYADELADLTREIAWMLGRDALQRRDAAEALRLANVLIEDDPDEDRGCELAIRAHLTIGDRSAAMREYQRYRNRRTKRGDHQNSELIATLVAEGRLERA